MRPSVIALILLAPLVGAQASSSFARSFIGERLPEPPIAVGQWFNRAAAPTLTSFQPRPLLIVLSTLF